MSKVICLISPKGGSGKTILTASFAALISSLNKKVLIIDIDAATNGLTFLYLKEIISHKNKFTFKDKQPAGIYETSVGNIADVVSLPNGVDLIPTAFSFIDLEDSFQKGVNTSLLENVLHYKKQYDYIFLDTQAGLHTLIQEAISIKISDEVIIVSEHDPLSTDSIERLKAFFPSQLTHERTWLLLNKILPEFTKGFNDCWKAAKYLYPIPWDLDVARACFRKQLALNLEIGNEFTLAILENLKILLNEDFTEKINHLSIGKALLIKEPIENEFIFSQRKLASLSHIQREIQRTAHFKMVIDKTFIFFAFLMSIKIIVGSVILFQNRSHSFVVISDASLTLILFSITAFLKLKALKKSLYYNEMVDNRKLRHEITTLEEKLQKLKILCYTKSKIHLTEREKSFSG